MNQKQNFIGLLIRVTVIVLFLLTISCISDRHIKNDNYKAQQELVSNLKSIEVNAVAINSTNFLNTHQVILSVINIIKFNYSDEKLVLFAEDNKISRIFKTLYNRHVLIKPQIISKFYYYFFSDNIKEFPVLS